MFNSIPLGCALFINQRGHQAAGGVGQKKMRSPKTTIHFILETVSLHPAETVLPIEAERFK